jgi:bis(5'-nucleosidyl)-tetraphosphatase
MKDFSCGGVVWDPGPEKLLMVQVENLSGVLVWTFPKGHPEGTESDAEAALREVREETGWTCSIDKPVMDVSYFYMRNDVRFQKTVRWFLMRPEKKVGNYCENEIRDCRWHSPEKAGELISYESDKKLLQRVFAMM